MKKKTVKTLKLIARLPFQAVALVVMIMALPVVWLMEWAFED